MKRTMRVELWKKMTDKNFKKLKINLKTIKNRKENSFHLMTNFNNLRSN